VRLSDGSIRNGYTVKVRNMEARPRTVEIGISGVPGVMWTEASGRSGAGRTVRLTVPADQVAKTQVFVAAPAAGAARTDMRFTVRAIDAEGGGANDDSYFERPEQGQ
jgi:polyferredoxin